MIDIQVSKEFTLTNIILAKILVSNKIMKLHKT